MWAIDTLKKDSRFDEITMKKDTQTTTFVSWLLDIPQRCMPVEWHVADMRIYTLG